MSWLFVPVAAQAPQRTGSESMPYSPVMVS
jgi:hypothetical protein